MDQKDTDCVGPRFPVGTRVVYEQLVENYLASLGTFGPNRFLKRPPVETVSLVRWGPGGWCLATGRGRFTRAEHESYWISARSFAVREQAVLDRVAASKLLE